MSNEKEILTRFFKGDSQRTIAAVLHVSRNTVAKVVQAYQDHPINIVARMSRQKSIKFLMNQAAAFAASSSMAG